MHNNISELPEFMPANGPYHKGSLSTTIGLVVTSGSAIIGRSLSDAADKVAHTPYSLAMWLRRRIYDTKQAHGRQTYFLGRVYNKLSGQNPYFISIKGIHLIQALKVVKKVKKGTNIDLYADYLLRYDIAEQIADTLVKQLQHSEEKP